MLDKAGNRGNPPEHGVFNIDTLDRPPLVDRSTEELLRLASSAASLAFRLFDPPDLSSAPPARRRGRWRSRR